jgi:hypothetical protein
MADAPKGQAISIDIDHWVDNFEMSVGSDTIKFVAKSYFVTSGDAVQKTLKMIDDLKTIDEYLDFIGEEVIYVGKEDMQKRLTQAKQLLTYFTDVRGAATFLEVEWNNHALYATPKNPRPVSAEL